MTNGITLEKAYNAVATTNADAYCIETPEEAEGLVQMWDDAWKKDILTEEDGCAYEMIAEQLDFEGDIKPRRIHVGCVRNPYGDFQFAFVLTEDNPNWD